jgi:hypothetical protein
MDSNQFDRLTRTIGTRRTFGLGVGAAALLGMADAATARKKNRKNCSRKAIKICTGNNCGKRKNNCGKTFNCKCRNGQTCLLNGSCGLACPVECPQEGGSCSCPSDGDQFCVHDDLSCDVTAKQCSSIADCPTGSACAETTCGPGGTSEKRCVRLCHPVP